jgi:hypothetical protein
MKKILLVAESELVVACGAILLDQGASHPARLPYNPLHTETEVIKSYNLGNKLANKPYYQDICLSKYLLPALSGFCKRDGTAEWYSQGDR